MSLVRWLFHSTAVVANYEANVETLDRLFGCVALHDEIDETPGVQRRGGMTWIGDNSIEIAEPLAVDSPGGKFLARTGGGMHSFGVQVADVDAIKDHLARAGVGIVAEPLDGILFTNPADTCGLLIEWCAVETSEDPRFGAPIAESNGTPVAPARRVAFVGAVVDEPVAAAQRLARVLDTKMCIVPGNDARLPIVALTLGDCMLALFALGTHARARVHSVGLLVDDLDACIDNLEGAGVATAWKLDSLAALDERTTPLPTFVTDSLLPGDPRR